MIVKIAMSDTAFAK